MKRALVGCTLFELAVIETQPDIIAPTIFIKSNLRVTSFLLPISLNMPKIEQKDAAPTDERIVFIIVKAGLFVSLS